MMVSLTMNIGDDPAKVRRGDKPCNGIITDYQENITLGPGRLSDRVGYQLTDER